MEDYGVLVLQLPYEFGDLVVEGCGGDVGRAFDMAADVICTLLVSICSIRRWKGRVSRPSSRTSIIAILEAGAGASRFEEVWARSICERSVEERRGSVETVCLDISVSVEWTDRDV